MASESEWVSGTKRPHSGANSGQLSKPVNPSGKKGPRSKIKPGKSTGRA